MKKIELLNNSLNIIDIKHHNERVRGLIVYKPTDENKAYLATTNSASLISLKIKIHESLKNEMIQAFYKIDNKNDLNALKALFKMFLIHEKNNIEPKEKIEIILNKNKNIQFVSESLNFNIELETKQDFVPQIDRVIPTIDGYTQIDLFSIIPMIKTIKKDIITLKPNDDIIEISKIDNNNNETKIGIIPNNNLKTNLAFQSEFLKKVIINEQQIIYLHSENPTIPLVATNQSISELKNSFSECEQLTLLMPRIIYK